MVRSSIEWIQERAVNGWNWYFTTDTESLVRILDTNFDMRDVVISADIVQEYKEYYMEEDINNALFSKYVFKEQDNNDGKLLIDVTPEGIIKYAFLDYACDASHIMSASEYMEWNMEGWQKPDYEYLDSEEK